MRKASLALIILLGTLAISCKNATTENKTEENNKRVIAEISR